ncbi:MAG: hypothetical protein ACRD29_17865 [Acidimicrobiales bacterium]
MAREPLALADVYHRVARPGGVFVAYHLGIDLGTTYTAAAMARDGRVESVPLAIEPCRSLRC